MDRRWVSRRALGLHATLAVVVPGCLALSVWQLDRAVTGNTLSWVYSFEWPFFAGYAIYLWWRLVHEEPSPAAAEFAHPRSEPGSEDPAVREPRADAPEPVPTAPSSGAGTGTGRGESGRSATPDDADEELEAYNRYLAALNESGKRKRW